MVANLVISLRFWENSRQHDHLITLSKILYDGINTISSSLLVEQSNKLQMNTVPNCRIRAAIKTISKNTIFHHKMKIRETTFLRLRVFFSF
jgi:hypothetical protein